MKKKDKILLFLLGILIFTGGLIFAYGVYINNYYAAFIYLPFKLLGIFFASFVSTHKPVRNKKKLDPIIRNYCDPKVDSFIQKNRSKVAMNFVIVVVVFTDIYLSFSKNLQAEPFNFSDAFSLAILYFFMIIGLGEGINLLYISLTAKKRKDK